MLLVMLGHTNIPAPIKTYIYTFHMPLFFFLSGYLFSLNKSQNVKTFLAKKTKTLILPYLCFSLIAYLWFVFLFIIRQVDYDHNPLLPILGSFIATRKSFWTVHTGALWFMNCLLFTEVLFYFLCKAGRTKKSIFLGLVSLSVIGCLYNKMVGKPLPWSIDISLISVGFYGLGFFYKEFKMKLERYLTLNTFIVFLITNMVTGYLNFVNSGERVDFYDSSLGNIILFYLSALSGIGMFVILIKQMKQSKILQYIGENSLIYLAFHQKIVFVLFNLIVQNTLLDSEKLVENPFIKGSLYTLMASLILVPVVFAIKRYFPFVLGKTKMPSSRQSLNL
jgi:acyltransferase